MGPYKGYYGTYAASLSELDAYNGQSVFGNHSARIGQSSDCPVQTLGPDLRTQCVGCPSALP